MKPLTTNAVKYAQLLVVFLVVAVAAILMNEKALTEKQKLEEKKTFLLKDSERLTGEIRILERRVTLLRSDLKTIEKAAKRKLGMTRPEETVYVFLHEDQPPRQRDNSESASHNEANPAVF
jgi:cell division protein FtsB